MLFTKYRVMALVRDRWSHYSDTIRKKQTHIPHAQDPTQSEHIETHRQTYTDPQDRHRYRSRHRYRLTQQRDKGLKTQGAGKREFKSGLTLI